MIDLRAIERRAMLLRDVTGPIDARRLAAAQSSDDMLSLVREVERLRSACSPEAAELARRLDAARLIPVDVGLLGELAESIASTLHTFARENAPKKGHGANWDVAAMPTAIRILSLVDRFIQGRLAPR